MKVLAIVPARAGSRRISDKNLRVLGGKPLVTRAIETALAATHIDRVVVSSDDQRVLAIAASYGKALALCRPRELATDTSLAIDYVRHALADAGARGQTFDAVAIVQPSSPLTSAADVDATIALLERSGADSAVTVVKLDHAIQPSKLKTLQGDRLMPYFEAERGRMAEHELPELYVRNGSVYAMRKSTIDAGSLLGEDSRAVVMPRERSIDINDELDLQFAAFLLEAAEL